MRRLAIGFVWFVVLYFGILGAGGALVASLEGTRGKNFEEGYKAGQSVGETFGRKYGTTILLVALGGAALGTLTGRLPGTKRSSAHR